MRSIFYGDRAFEKLATHWGVEDEILIRTNIFITFDLSYVDRVRERPNTT